MLAEPVVPPAAVTLVTNSAKFAHYAPGLVGREVRFASLESCVAAAVTGRVPRATPSWCGDGVQKPPRQRGGGATPLAPLAPLVPLAPPASLAPLAPLAPVGPVAPFVPLAPLTVAPGRRALHIHVAPAAVRVLRRVLR